MSQWCTKAFSVGTGLVLCLTVTSLSLAQPNNATINANATVLQPVTVTAGQDLDFGNVFPGVNKTLAPDAPTAGRWDVTGSSGAEIALALTTPANLSDGTNNLAIVFGAGSAGYATTSVAPTTTFDPAAGATASLSGALPGELYVWIGGTVQPTADQPSGVYTGTVTLTVNYTGN